MNKKKFLIPLIVVLTLTLASFLFLFSNINKKSVPSITNSPVSPLAFFTTVETPKGTIYLYMNQDYIDLNAAETPHYEKAPIIKKENYPKLFKQGIANSSALRVEYYKESKDGEVYVKLSNIQPDHASYTDTYAILVDPFTGIVKEGKTINEVSGKASF